MIEKSSTDIDTSQLAPLLMAIKREIQLPAAQTSDEHRQRGDAVVQALDRCIIGSPDGPEFGSLYQKLRDYTLMIVDEIAALKEKPDDK